MGILDFLLGRRSSGDDIDDGIEKERKVYGNLYSGGAGRIDRKTSDPSEEIVEKNDRNFDRKISHLQDDLHDVERRARDLHAYDDQVRKKMGKLESSIGGVRDASSPLIMSQRNAKLRTGLKKSYNKIKQENDRRLEKLRHDGATEGHIRREELKLDKIRKDMSSMYRRSGGSGTLK